MGFIRNEDAKRYMRHLPRYPRKSFTATFPRVNPTAIDLIERMLTFNPLQRITGINNECMIFTICIQIILTLYF
jgi:hypothetical protein